MAQEQRVEAGAPVRVLFWGTPEFALPTLRAVEVAGHDVVGVVTRPDRPRGRGLKTAPSPVRRFAGEQGFRVLAPETPRGNAFEGAIREMAPDVSIVVAYGRILHRRILDVPARGSFNLHASLLPALRGAAPINWAIARGHTETGVSVMRMVEAMDAGPVLALERTPIGPTDTAASLAPRLAEMGARLVAKTLDRMESGSVEEVEQDHAAATFAPGVDRAAARIDWNRDAGDLASLIRGMDSVPGAWTRLDGAPVKVFSPEVAVEALQDPAGGPFGDAAAHGTKARGVGDSDGAPSRAPGLIVAADPRQGLMVACGTGFLRIREVQPAGRRRMDAAAWVRGRGPRAGDRFE